MQIVKKRLGKGTLTDSLANIDDQEVPSDTIRVVKAITLCNAGQASATVDITFAGTSIVHNYSLIGTTGGDGPSENTITIPFIDQILHQGERIQGKSSVTGVVHYYISGIEEN